MVRNEKLLAASIFWERVGLSKQTIRNPTTPYPCVIKEMQGKTKVNAMNNQRIRLLLYLIRILGERRSDTETNPTGFGALSMLSILQGWSVIGCLSV
jgi:hypothetical protein